MSINLFRVPVFQSLYDILGYVFNIHKFCRSSLILKALNSSNIDNVIIMIIVVLMVVCSIFSFCKIFYKRCSEFILKHLIFGRRDIGL